MASAFTDCMPMHYGYSDEISRGLHVYALPPCSSQQQLFCGNPRYVSYRRATILSYIQERTSQLRKCPRWRMNFVHAYVYVYVCRYTHVDTYAATFPLIDR